VQNLICYHKEESYETFTCSDRILIVINSYLSWLCHITR